jgi:amidophosphoribosyltransferase
MPKAGMLVAASGVEDAGRWAREILAHARRAEGEARVLSRTAGEEPEFVAGEVGSQAVIGLKGQGSLWSGCWAQGTIAVAMEGGLTNRARLRGAFLDEGGFLSSVEAAELILALLSRSDQKTFINRLLDAARQLEGGFALVAMDREKLVGIRDPWGLRSLSVGRVGSGYALATESSAFEPGAFIRELAPGELLIVEEGRLEAIRPFPRRPKKFCTLELSSLSNPATSYGEREAHAARIRLGEILARQAPAWGDLVVGF